MKDNASAVRAHSGLYFSRDLVFAQKPALFGIPCGIGELLMFGIFLGTVNQFDRPHFPLTIRAVCSRLNHGLVSVFNFPFSVYPSPHFPLPETSSPT